MQIIPILVPQLRHSPRASMRVHLLGCRHRLLVLWKEVPEAVIIVHFDGGALGRVEDWLREVLELDGEPLLFTETCAAQGGDATIAVVVFAGMSIGGGGEGGGLVQGEGGEEESGGDRWSAGDWRVEYAGEERSGCAMHCGHGEDVVDVVLLGRPTLPLHP